MKLKKNKVYEALYISDIHYLMDNKIKEHSNRELFKMLGMLRKRNVKFQKFILVGDVIENWFFSATKKLKKKRKSLNRLFDRFEKVCLSTTEKVYLVGNHDAVRYDMRLPQMIEDYLKDRGWEICEVYETGKIVAAHGHQGQYGKIFWFVNIGILRLFYFLAGLFPDLYRICEDFYRKHFNFDRHNTREQMIAYYSRLSRVVNQKDRLLISGHTHQFLHLDDLKVINTGDWVESRTFVVQDDDSFFGLRYEGTKKFVKEFKYRHMSVKSS